MWQKNWIELNRLSDVFKVGKPMKTKINQRIIVKSNSKVSNEEK